MTRRHNDNTRRRPTARRALALLGLLLFASLAGGGRFGVSMARAQVAQDTFVGNLKGLNASIAIVSDGSGVIAYVCDGAGNTISADFSGTIDQAQNGALTLQADYGTILTINADASTLPAMLVPDGKITGSVLTPNGLCRRRHKSVSLAAASPFKPHWQG